jgi:hypothetical protein
MPKIVENKSEVMDLMRPEDLQEKSEFAESKRAPHLDESKSIKDFFASSIFSEFPLIFLYFI